VREIEAILPPGVTIEPYYDRTIFVSKVIRTVRNNLLEGGLLVMAVLFLFLGDLRAGVIVASAIPLSMLIAFSGMMQAGLSGNLMSLGAIDFGLIVDGAVIIVENCLRCLAERQHTLGRTLTLPEPRVENVEAFAPELLEQAAQLALSSRHPLAQALAREGVNVTICARGAEALNATAKELGSAGVKVTPVVCDVTTEAGRKALLAACPDPDILINNNGGPPLGDFRKLTREDWLRAIDMNMLTPIELIKATVDSMIAKNFGRVVNITSSAVKASSRRGARRTRHPGAGSSPARTRRARTASTDPAGSGSGARSRAGRCRPSPLGAPCRRAARARRTRAGRTARARPSAG